MKKKTQLFLGISLLFSIVGIFLLSDRSLLSPLAGELVGVLVAIMLFLSSLFLIRLISTDIAFSAWKKFVKYFGAVVVILAVFGMYDDEGGSWALGADVIPLVPLTIFLYIVGSIIVIRRYRKAKE